MKLLQLLCVAALLLSVVFSVPSCTTQSDEQTLTLRVCNWEEYIDLGGWDDEETISLDSGDVLGVNAMYDDFEQWYYETYGIRVEVEYSTFGTNEDLYNQLTLGDRYDLVCPSEYMIMKLMAEDRLQPLSDAFFDTSDPLNFYANGVSPYIASVFSSNQINGQTWDRYASGYMWGITGVIYNPDVVSREDASTWGILSNKTYHRQVTIKDNVRDAYFPALGILNRDTLLDPAFTSSATYAEDLFAMMNDTRPETVNAAEKLLKDIRQNVYSFETDSGKSDMVTGKVVANLQWSGDAVYAMDQAEEEGISLDYAVPEECTNLWFDGWVMLKDGISEDPRKQHAAEAFINYLSMPENVVRNMYYVGYTSAISGGEDSTIYEYIEWLYGAEEEGEDTVEYPLGYFFSGENDDARYMLRTPEEQTRRQLFAQYPSQEVIRRSAVMNYFDEQANKRINQMWINVRCFSFGQ